MSTHHTPPWADAGALLREEDGAWSPVDEKTLAGKHTSADIMFVLARIGGIRPPLGQSLFTGVLHRVPGTALTDGTVAPLAPERYRTEAHGLEQAENVLTEALLRHGAGGGILSAFPVDEIITRYLDDLTSSDDSGPAPEPGQDTPIDARGLRDLVGAIEAEAGGNADGGAADEQPRHGFLHRLLARRGGRPGQSEDPAHAEHRVVAAPQWLAVDAIKMIDVARIVSLSSWEEALRGLPPRVCQLLWTAADDPAASPGGPYRPAHDPDVIAAFAAVPYEERAAAIRPGVRTHDAVLCRRYGRDPVDDHAAARLRAVREAAGAWEAWQEELADGALAARGLINVEGLAAIGRDPFLRQRYAYDIKRTVETERWVTSWLDAGGSLTD